MGNSGWKWSLFTLAMLIVAGVTMSTVLAGSEGASCPAAKASACCASAPAAAQGAAGEKEQGEAKSCPVAAKETGSCAAKSAADGKCAKADKEKCCTKQGQCPKGKDPAACTDKPAETKEEPKNVTN